MFCRLLRACALVALVGLPALSMPRGPTASTTPTTSNPWTSTTRAVTSDPWPIRPPTVYTAGDSRMLTVLDSSDPANLVEAGTLGLPGAVGKLALQGDVAAVTYTDSEYPAATRHCRAGAPGASGRRGDSGRPAFRGALGHACLRAGLGLHAEQPRRIRGGSERSPAPQVVGRVEVGDYPNNVVLAGSYAYVIDS